MPPFDYLKLKKAFFDFIKSNPNIWDYLIYIGGGIIAVWFIWAIFNGRKVKVKDSISVSEVKKAKWSISKGIPTVASSRRFITRLNFLNKRIEEEKKVIKASGDMIEQRARKKFLEEAEKELDGRKG